MLFCDAPFLIKKKKKRTKGVSWLHFLNSQGTGSVYLHGIPVNQSESESGEGVRGVTHVCFWLKLTKVVSFSCGAQVDLQSTHCFRQTFQTSLESTQSISSLFCLLLSIFLIHSIIFLLRPHYASVLSKLIKKKNVKCFLCISPLFPANIPIYDAVSQHQHPCEVKRPASL